MPAVSRSQIRWAFAAKKRGELTEKQAKDFTDTPQEDLPEHVHKAEGGEVECPKCGHYFSGGPIVKAVEAVAGDKEEAPEPPKKKSFWQALKWRKKTP